MTIFGLKEAGNEDMGTGEIPNVVAAPSDYYGSFPLTEGTAKAYKVEAF